MGSKFSVKILKSNKKLTLTEAASVTSDSITQLIIKGIWQTWYVLKAVHAGNLRTLFISFSSHPHLLLHVSKCQNQNTFGIDTGPHFIYNIFPFVQTFAFVYHYFSIKFYFVSSVFGPPDHLYTNAMQYADNLGKKQFKNCVFPIET